MHDKLPGQERIGHGMVIDEVTDRVDDLGLAQDRMARIGGHVDDRALGVTVDQDIAVAGHTLDLVGGQVTRHVDIAFFQQQSL